MSFWIYIFSIIGIIVIIFLLVYSREENRMDIKQDFYLTSGNFHVKMNNLTKAINSYDKVISLRSNILDPYKIKALYNKGIILFKFNKFEEALNCFNRVLEKKKKSINTHFAKIMTLLELGKINEVMPHLEQSKGFYRQVINDYFS